MGATSSSEGAKFDASFAAYVKGLSNCGASGTMGGSASTTGGYSALEDYGNSMFSKAKGALIRSIAKEVSGVLKIPAGFAEKADLKDVIAKFAAVVPDPRQGRKIKVDKKIHIEVCKKMAHAINNAYKSDLINVDDTAEHVCQAVSELLYSLFTGLHSEFISVAADVSRIMGNLNALQEYVDGVNNKLMVDLEACSPGEASTMKEAYAALTREIRRQHATLANLSTGVVGPTGTSLINLLEETKSMPGLTANLKSMTGTREFTDKLSSMLGSTSSVSHAAYLVDKALKQIGMSVKDYKNTHSMKELRHAVYNMIVKKKPNSDAMQKMLTAADILYRNDLSHDDIAAHLSKKGGSIMGGFDGGFDGGALDAHYGEGSGFADMVSDSQYKSPDSVYKGRTHADKRSIGRELHKRDVFRERLFSSLNQEIRVCYEQIIADVYKIGKKIGSEVKITDQLHSFIRQLGYLSATQPERKDLHKALSGYRRDVKSEYVKHDFLKALDAVRLASSELATGANGSLFKGIESSVAKLIKVIDDFNDTFTKTLTEVHVDTGVQGGKRPKDYNDINPLKINKRSDAGRVSIGTTTTDIDTADTLIDTADTAITDLTTARGEVDALAIGTTPTADITANGTPYFVRGTAVTDASKTTALGLIATDMEAANTTKATANTDRAALGDMSSVTNGNAVDEAAEAKFMTGGAADFKYLVTIKKAIREIEYYFKIANIKANLKAAAASQPNYTKDYENILGEECGMIIDHINTNFKALTSEVATPTAGGVGDVRVRWRVAYDTAAAADKDGIDKQWKAYVFFLEYIRSAKVEMIEAAQALDLYLSKFTEHIQANPDDIKDFVKLLEQIEIVSKWFTDKSGDNLVSVFEAFSGGHQPEMPLSSTDATTTNITGHYYKKLHEVNATGHTKDEPGDWTKGYEVKSVEEARGFITRLEKSLKSMRALENIIATFAKLSNRTGGDDTHTFMSPGLIFRAFTKYTVATSIALGKMKYKDAGGASATESVDATTATYKAYVGPAVPVVGGIHKTNTVVTEWKNIITVFPRPTDSVMYDTQYFDPLMLDAGYSSTDEIFEMCIKSMVSKVFTVVGAFSLFHRPAHEFATNKAISNRPLRQIMGGASVQVIPEAVELYIRLPLLGEWYRELFGFRNTTGTTGIVTSMIPSFDGIWADFVKVIFVDAVGVNDGGYTSTFTDDLVRSINSIYLHYKPKYGGDVCTKVLEQFVAEVNKRYGIVLQSDINTYLTEQNAGLADTSYNAEDNVDYDILDSKDQFSRKAAPSDRFRKETHRTTGSAASIKNKKFLEEIDNFRIKVDAALRLPSSTSGTLPSTGQFGVLGAEYGSVDDLVRQTTKKLKEATTDDAKFSVVRSTVMGVDKYADIDYDAMLMFHETVINPITILYTIYRMVNHFNKFANSMNVGDGSKNNPTLLTAVLKTLPGSNKYRTETTAGTMRDQYMYFGLEDYERYNGAGGAGTAITPVGYTLLMEDTIDHLFYMTCDKNPLVELYYSGNGQKRYPVLSFAKLEKHVTELVENVGEALVKFRKYIPHSVISKYEDNTQGEFTMTNAEPKNPNVASLFYIKEHLVDRLLKNKYGGGLSDANAGIKNIWMHLTTGTTAGAPTPHTILHGPVIRKMVYWNANTPQITQTQINGIRTAVANDVFDPNSTIVAAALAASRYATQANIHLALNYIVSDQAFPAAAGAGGVIAPSAPGIIVGVVPAGPLAVDAGGLAPTADLPNGRIAAAANATNAANSDLNVASVIAHAINALRTAAAAAAPTALDAFLTTIGQALGVAIGNVAANSNSASSATVDAIMTIVKARLPNAYNFGARTLKSTTAPNEWTKFPINVIGLTKQSALADQRVPKQVSDALMADDYTGIGSAAATEIYRGDDMGAGGSFGFHGVYDYDVVNPSTGATTDQTTGIVHDHTGDHINGATGSFGLVFKLNRMLYHYINMFTDKTSNKIYLPLLEKLANGPNAREIMKGLAIDDITPSAQTRDDVAVAAYDAAKTVYDTAVNAAGGGAVSADVLAAWKLAQSKYTNRMKINTQAKTAAFPQHEIDPNSVLFATLARAIRNIVTDRKAVSSATILSLAETNLMTVPDYMKDMMTAYLPIFDKQINILCARADLIKNLIENTGLRVVGNTPGAISAIPGAKKVEDDGVALALHIADAGGGEPKSKNHIITMLSSVLSTARSLQGCVRSVYKELADIPLYFETYQNSITDYKNRTGMLPLMPLSHTSHLLNNMHRLVEGGASDHLKLNTAHGGAVRGDDSTLKYYTYKGLIPHVNAGVGSNEFKFAYGTRGLLSDEHEPNIQHAPGVMGVMEAYNAKVGGAASYDKRKMTDSFVTSVHLLRYATDYIYHKTYLGNNDLNKLTNFFVVGVTGANTTFKNPNNAAGTPLGQTDVNVLQHLACQTGRHTLNDNSSAAGLIATNDAFFIKTGNITRMIENDNHKQSVYRLLKCVVDSGIPQYMQAIDRSAMRIYNILDANIVPINFHALQREVALVNIFNYSYTFDQFVKERVGVQTAARLISEINLTKAGVVGELVRPGGADTKITRYPEDALVRILLEPRGKRYKTDYVNNIWRLMAGNDSMTLNRPKYLSDQLWNKVLLNSMFSNENAAGAAIALPRVGQTVHNVSADQRTMRRGHPYVNTYQEPIDAAQTAIHTTPGAYPAEARGALLNTSPEITYIGHVDTPAHKYEMNVVQVITDAGVAAKWHHLGHERYHTNIVRYIEWFVHIQRVMRLLMRDQLTWVIDPIVHQSDALAEQITEYSSSRKFELGDFE